MAEQRRYLVKELFGPTLQGEGAHAGTACVFLRFAICNLACSWCDTDFAPNGAQRMGATTITERLVALDTHGSRLVIVTGGEPSLQWDAPLAEALSEAGFAVHMESNGTRALAAPVDWLTISPKPRFHDGKEALADGLSPDECKVVLDGSVSEATLAGYEARYPNALLFLQPCDDCDAETHSMNAIALVSKHPRWRLSVQLHKLLGLP